MACGKARILLFFPRKCWIISSIIRKNISRPREGRAVSHPGEDQGILEGHTSREELQDKTVLIASTAAVSGHCSTMYMRTRAWKTTGMGKCRQLLCECGGSQDGKAVLLEEDKIYY